MAKSFEALRGKMSSERQERNVHRALELLTQMPLQKLRHARSRSQEQLAKILKVKQESISELERHTDMYISTLRDFLNEMGGTLEIVARFPEGDVNITRFEEISRDETST